MDKIEIYNAFCINEHKLKPWRTFIFVDCPQYLATKCFSNYGVNPLVFKEMYYPELKYSAFVCAIRKSKTNEFLHAMHDLQKAMLICGYSDYQEFCKELGDALLDAEQGGDADD